MSSSSPVLVKFTKAAVRASKSISTGLLKEYDPEQDLPDSIAGIGYAITCHVESNPYFSGTRLIQDPNCFVHISSVGSKYSFARIASVADMDYILPERSGLVEGDTFRSSSFTVVYSDVDTAVASIPVITERISLLYKLRIDLLGSFTEETAAIYLPLPEGSGTQDAYVNTYKAKKASRVELESSLSSIQTTYSVAKEKEIVQSKMFNLVATLVDKLDKAKASITDTVPLYSSAPVVVAAIGLIDTFISEIPDNSDSKYTNTALRSALTSLKNSINASLNIGVGQTFKVDSSTTLSFYLTNTYLELLGQKTAASQGVFSAAAYTDNYLSQLKESKQALDSAIAAEAAALADISRYCPDVNTSSL